ncbi:MAG TPA: hypothetical protein VGS98_16310 [Thermoanaerobaculia bacterium]|nr:hypothetical protein [Thermoanaerobaculia bacterium]
MRLVWSQPSRPTHDRARHLLLLSVLCIFLGGTLVGAGGRDPREAPRALRAAVASLLSTGAVFFLIGITLFAVRKPKKPAVRLSLAEPLDPSGVAARAPRFGQEERR